MNALSSLNEDVKAAVENNTFYKKKSEKPGIIVYYTDGYESVTTDNFTADQFNMADYKRNSLDDQEQVTAIPLPTNGFTVKNGKFCSRYPRIWQKS